MKNDERAWEEYKVVRDTLIAAILAFICLFIAVGFGIGNFLYSEIGVPLWLSILAGVLTFLLPFLGLLRDMGASIRRHLE